MAYPKYYKTNEFLFPLSISQLIAIAVALIVQLLRAHRGQLVLRPTDPKRHIQKWLHLGVKPPVNDQAVVLMVIINSFNMKCYTRCPLNMR